MATGIGGAQLDIGAFERQDSPPVVQMDYGDVPDATGGSGPGNYNTRAADNGPSHTIVAGLRLGATVDGDDGMLQNAAANADDVNGALPDDEDGLNNPAADLVLTVGAQPTVNVRVTNTTARPPRSTAGSTTTPTACSTMRRNGLRSRCPTARTTAS